jgi:NADPH:quinone reductase-like Zn-dependent oxidoreductase
MVMKAALVTSFAAPPRYAELPPSLPTGPDDLVVDVLAAGLHPRVRSQADGSHYTSTGRLPLVPGIDGVGIDGEGRLRYFVLEDAAMGSMAEQTVIDRRRSVALPAASDPIAIAAAMNPAMSSWLALRRRAPLHAGQSVLVLGATGNAGRMAVPIARLLGADRIVAAGRDGARLAGLMTQGATDLVCLSGDADEVARRLAAAASEVDVVLDYLWGAPTAAAMAAIVSGRADRGRTLTWIEIGSVAGPTASLPSAALRAARLQIVGSGQGSVGTAEILAELPALAREIAGGSFPIDAVPVPLRDVEAAWTAAPRGTERIVITPRPPLPDSVARA